MANDLCFIDIETTGSIFGFHEITELSAIITSPDAYELINRFEVKIKPKHPERITEVAQKLSNYNDADWLNAKESNKELWMEISEFWHTCIPICHNPSFERAFITLAMVETGITTIGLDYHWIGTESLAWPFHLSGRIKNISLSALLTYFGLPQEPLPHRATNGAMSCRNVYIKLIEVLQKQSDQAIV
jgi:DNA polymerase III epsilon subunit-like protein